MDPSLPYVLAAALLFMSAVAWDNRHQHHLWKPKDKK